MKKIKSILAKTSTGMCEINEQASRLCCKYSEYTKRSCGNFEFLPSKGLEKEQPVYST